MFKVNDKDIRTMSVTLFWCFYCWLGTYFTPFFQCLLLTLSNYLLAEIELLMCNCNRNCFKWTATGPKQGACCRKCSLQKNVQFREGLIEIWSKLKKKKKKKREAEDGNRNFALTTNLISLTILKLFGLSIKAAKIKVKKKLSDASMSTVECVSKIFSAFFCRSLTLHQSSISVTVMKPVVHRGVEYGLKVPVPYHSIGWLQRVTWKKR